jgi:hypothetical protein
VIFDMSVKKSIQDPQVLLPWYANDTLTPDERRAVEDWLHARPDADRPIAAWRCLRAAAIDQPFASPSPDVRRQLLARAAAARRPRPIHLSWAWASGALTAIIVLVVWWIAVQPGIRLHWSISDDGATAYRIYRALDGSQQFNLLSEVPARPGTRSYSFVDTSPVPGQTYTYLVEVVNSGGALDQRTIAGNGLDILPAQLALVVASIAIGYATMNLIVGPSSLIPTRKPFAV